MLFVTVCPILFSRLRLFPYLTCFFADGNMPPMTPVTPMTPITPITPFTPMTPLTPNTVRSGSPPKPTSLGVSSLSLPSMVVPNSSSCSTALRPPATPTRSQPSALADNPLSAPHWLQLEEVSASGAVLESWQRGLWCRSFYEPSPWPHLRFHFKLKIWVHTRIFRVIRNWCAIYVEL